MSSSTKALVLGGSTGLLGKILVDRLNNSKDDYSIFTLGRNDGDIYNKKFLQEKIDEIQPDVIFNAIAYTQVDKAEEEKELAYKINRDFPKTVAQIIQNSSTKLVHFSTDFVFDGNSEIPYTEEDEPNPVSVYGASKLAGENAIRELIDSNSIIIRTAWLFGPGKRNFISAILDKAIAGEQLRIVHDQVGSPTYTIGLACNSLALYQANVHGIFNVTNSGFASWLEFADEALQIADIHANIQPIATSELNQIAKRPSFSVLSNDKMAEALGMTPRTWTQALRDYIYDHLDIVH